MGNDFADDGLYIKRFVSLSLMKLGERLRREFIVSAVLIIIIVMIWKVFKSGGKFDLGSMLFDLCLIMIVRMIVMWILTKK